MNFLEKRDLRLAELNRIKPLKKFLEPLLDEGVTCDHLIALYIDLALDRSHGRTQLAADLIERSSRTVRYHIAAYQLRSGWILKKKKKSLTEGCWWFWQRVNELSPMFGTRKEALEWLETQK